MADWDLRLDGRLGCKVGMDDGEILPRNNNFTGNLWLLIPFREQFSTDTRPRSLPRGLTLCLAYLIRTCQGSRSRKGVTRLTPDSYPGFVRCRATRQLDATLFLSLGGVDLVDDHLLDGN